MDQQEEQCKHEQKQDKLFYDMMKVHLAQLDSAIKISNIICDHSSKENKELTGDDIICGLVYRLMIPMKQEEIDECMDNAEKILDPEESGEEEEEELFDQIENYDKPTISRKIKSIQCNCEICSQVRICLCNYESFEPTDPLAQRFKDSIQKTCLEHKIYI